MNKLFAFYLSCCAVAFVAVAVPSCVKGAGISKCPADAVCGFINIGGEDFYLCATPAQLQAAKMKAARLVEAAP